MSASVVSGSGSGCPQGIELSAVEEVAGGLYPEGPGVGVRREMTGDGGSSAGPSGSPSAALAGDLGSWAGTTPGEASPVPLDVGDLDLEIRERCHPVQEGLAPGEVRYVPELQLP